MRRKKDLSSYRRDFLYTHLRTLQINRKTIFNNRKIVLFTIN